jgi:hypothetical protein
VQAIVCIVFAVAIVAFRWPVLLATGAVAGLATGVGLLLGVHIGLFGYTESLSVPYAVLSSPPSSPPPSYCWPPVPSRT